MEVEAPSLAEIERRAGSEQRSTLRCSQTSEAAGPGTWDG